MLCGMFCAKIPEVTGECSVVKISNREYLLMQILPETVSANSSHVLKIENHTKKVMNYGHHFHLEYFDGNNWIDIKLDIVWETILLGLKPRKVIEEQMVSGYLYSLVEKYNNSKKGRYRIVKEFIVMWTNEGYHLCAEFEII
jgi:hypothetical protein